jgi:hypothetical protein
MRSVLLATGGASVGKWLGRAQQFLKLIAISGSAVLATAGTVDIERNGKRPSWPLVGI